MKKYRMFLRPIRFIFSALLCLGAAGQFTPAWAAKAVHAPDAIWVHDALYGTVATDTSFKSPPPQSTDVIFSFMGGGLEGQRSVAVYAPGDPEYNGGRWNVMLVTFTDSGKTFFDPDGDGTVNFELTNAEDVLSAAELGYLTLTEPGVYFECPLLRLHNHD
jgi:hypothetical protein